MFRVLSMLVFRLVYRPCRLASAPSCKRVDKYLELCIVECYWRILGLYRWFRVSQVFNQCLALLSTSVSLSDLPFAVASVSTSELPAHRRVYCQIIGLLSLIACEPTCRTLPRTPYNLVCRKVSRPLPLPANQCRQLSSPEMANIVAVSISLLACQLWCQPVPCTSHQVSKCGSVHFCKPVTQCVV